MNKWVRRHINISRSNKIHLNVKGIMKIAGFITLMCEQGSMHVDKVKFDQVNNTNVGGVDQK